VVTNKSALLELASRIEAATGPDHDLDRDIAAALGAKWVERGPFAKGFTASIDAAISLTPEGWYLGDLTQCNEDDEPQACLTQIEPPHRDAGATGATLALALTAAALRALAKEKGE
jgi:hypothetical protein